MHCTSADMRVPKREILIFALCQTERQHFKIIARVQFNWDKYQISTSLTLSLSFGLIYFGKKPIANIAFVLFIVLFVSVRLNEEIIFWLRFVVYWSNKNQLNRFISQYYCHTITQRKRNTYAPLHTYQS